MRHGSKTLRKPGAGANLQVGTGTGTNTPNSAAAQVNVPVTPGVGTQNQRRLSTQKPGQAQGTHPYAIANVSSTGGDYTATTGGRNLAAGTPTDESTYAGGVGYGRTSPMVSAAAPPAVSNVRAWGGDVGVAANGVGVSGAGYDQQDELGVGGKTTFLARLFSCRC